MKKLIVATGILMMFLSCNSTKKTTIVEKNAYENAYDDFLEPNETKVYSWYLGVNSVRGKEAYIVRMIYPEKKQITSLSTYKYDDRTVLHGKYISWSDDGFKTSEGNYENNYRENTWKFYSSGKLSSEGNYVKGDEQGIWKNYHDNGKIESELNWEKGVREGAFIEYDSFGIIVNEGIYKADSIILQTLKVEPPKRYQNGDIFTIVEQMPRFPGCEYQDGDNKSKKACADQKLLKFIYDNIKYPTHARENAAEGMVVISFTVMEDGSIANVYAIRGVCEPLEKECLRIVSMMPVWSPGRQDGVPVRVKYNLPVKFKLN